MVAIAVMCLELQLPAGAPRGQMHPEWGPEPPVAPVSHDALPAEKITPGIVFPVLGAARFKDDYNEDRGHFRHTGIDVKAPKMSPVVAPISGVIGLKKESFWIYGSDYAVLGTHLNDDLPGRRDHAADRDWMFAPDLEPNEWVEQGRFIGYVGESGDATAPHVHFELYRLGDGTSMDRVRNPFPALTVAARAAAPKPVERFKDSLGAGEARIVGCLRKFDAATRVLTAILVDKTFDGKTSVVTIPAYRRFLLTPEQIESLGGAGAIDGLKRSRPISFVVDAKKLGEPIPVTRVALAP